jgi:hypothetical protein
MSDGSTNRDESDRPATSGDGILGAVLFALLSLLLIATLPTGGRTSADRPLDSGAAASGARP